MTVNNRNVNHTRLCMCVWRSRSRRHQVLEDVLEDVLVENADFERRDVDDDELNNDNVATSARTSSDSATTGVHRNNGRRPITNSSSSSSAAAAAAAGGREGVRRLTSVIMMYSPYIPSIDEQRGTAASISSRSTDIGNYYSRIDTEESVKCVVTSVLFCAVIAVIILVAVFINPGMWSLAPYIGMDGYQIRLYSLIENSV